MDGHSRSLCSSSSSHHAYYQENQDQISYLLGATSSSYPPPHAVGSLQSKAEKMSLSFCDAGAGNDFGAVGPSGTDQFSLLNSTRKSPDPELDSLDCEIEDGAEVSEERAKLAPVRTSSSKRNRAAEVHNLSEKRRRSKINEKMKALQSLIPNSSKTDKASMLDEAIEYLKQLQLQVQMLSMRNSLSQHPIYMSGALQALQMGVDFGLVTDKGSSVPNSFDLSTSSHQSASIPSIINITRPATSFAMESSQSHHGSYLSPASIEDILTRELIPHQQPDARHSPRNLTGNEVNSMAATASQHSRGQAPALVGADHAEECILGRVRSHDVLSEEPEKETFLQHLPR